MILLGLRTTYKEDIRASPAEMVYGTTLRIPSEFFCENSNNSTQTDFANLLRGAMRELRPRDTAWHGQRNVFVHPDLQSCTNVFVRNDSIRPSLSSPYDGPFKVLARTEKHYKISMNGRNAFVSVDRLKPAYTIIEQPSVYDRAATTTTTTSTVQPTVTRSGRRVKIPLRYH